MKRLCLGIAVLWLITAGALAWMFTKGWTTPGADGRTEIVLTPIERDQILLEMRQLLKAVHAVVDGAARQNLESVEAAARSVGMNEAADVDPTIMMKLPLPFKQMGMSVHRDFDALADSVAHGESVTQVLDRLSSITTRCTTCHDLYRLSGTNH